MSDNKKRTFLHKLFIFSIIIKGIDGVLETVGGSVLFFIKSQKIVQFIQQIFHHELAQDPHDVIANYLIKAVRHLSHGTMIFAAVYLSIHGLIKMGLVSALLKKKLWAYPLAAIILSLFVLYEIFRFFFTYSYILLFLIIVDIIIVILLRIEYKELKTVA